MAVKTTGNLSGLKPSQLKALHRLGQRRYPNQGGYSLEQARELAALSRSLGRQIGLLIDRQGRPFLILVGDAGGIYIPELPRAKSSGQRLRGLRLLHTHLEDHPDFCLEGVGERNLLSPEDLMDLLFLRLDSLSVLTVGPMGEPLLFQQAHLLPPNPAGRPSIPHPPRPWERVDTDFAAQTLALEEELSRTHALLHGSGVKGREKVRCLLAHISGLPKAEQESSLEELRRLAETAGLSVAGALRQQIRGPDPRQALSRAKLAELEVLALQGDVQRIVFDLELSPLHLRNLAEATERPVMDRTQLILDIFASRAGSQAGKLQVELAQLQYRLPRLAQRHKAFDRLAGGIGGRGPGETKLESDRRRLHERITKIKAELKELRRRRAFARTRRARSGLPVVALVGYTNAGKSTLLNALTGAQTLIEDKLFATLDPCSRRLRLQDQSGSLDCILTDTVGFIRSLPQTLLEAFQATLEELEAADLLLHLADAAHPEVEKQIRSVEKILDGLKLQQIPRLLILNKSDLLQDLLDLPPDLAPELHISASQGRGLPELGRLILKKIRLQGMSV